MKSKNPCSLLPNFFFLALGATLTTTLIPSTSVNAQSSITAAPDGTGTIINHNGNTYHIEGGTQAGANLFHSFQQFGLNPQEIANFLSNPQIQNVLGRVTGGDPSIIQGLIQLTGGNSNLFLMNPAGWVFTQGASLDVPGSFGVTTATRMAFGEGYFNAYGENLYSELLGNPTSLIFDQKKPSLIVNQGHLAVPEGESLWVVGGGVISTGTIEAPNGNITIAAVPGKNQIELSSEGMVLDLVLKATPTEGEVSLPNGLTGIKPTDIPALLTGGNVKEADTVIIGDDGSVRLVASDTVVNQGDTVIAGEINAENITLMAAGRVTPTDYDLVSNNPTVVLFPENIGDPVEATFIDEGVKDYQDFLYGGEKGTISQVVTHQENGIDTVTASLAEIADQGGEISAVHLLTEGNEGEFWLGNAYVNNETIAQYKAQMEQWGENLSSIADILLYACYTALGDEGMKLIQTIADSTGADVAASTNLTGNAALGGDWELERTIGRIEARLGFEQQVLDDFTGKLAVFTASDAASLINAINTANSNSETDTINLSGDILLTSVDNTTDSKNGLPVIISSFKLTINGMGNSIKRDTNSGIPNFRILEIDGGNLELNHATISGGVADGSEPRIEGGGIANKNGTVTVNYSTILGNTTLAMGTGMPVGGGIFNSGTLTVQNSTISGNVLSSSLSGNTWGNGGGIYNSGTLTVQNSTISGNNANNGGGIYNSGTLTVQNSTISGNNANNGGGIHNIATTTIQNTIVAQNTAGTNPDLDGGFNIEYSLIGDTTGATTFGPDTNNIKNQDPQLMPLGDYGGPTQTHALKLTSPALNAGNNALVPTGVTTDQRGNPGQRVVDGTVDIGAFEWQGFEIVPVGSQNQTLSSLPANNLDMSVKVVEAWFNVIPSVGTNVNFSISGTVEGSFTNGTTVVTNADGIAANFFEVLSATGDFSILAGVTGLESLTFNITNAVPEEAAAAAAADTDISVPPDFTPIWDSIIDELEEDVLLGNACQTVPELELELDDDGEELELEEEEEEEQQYDRDCRPVSDERGDIE